MLPCGHCKKDFGSWNEQLNHFCDPILESSSSSANEPNIEFPNQSAQQCESNCSKNANSPKNQFKFAAKTISSAMTSSIQLESLNGAPNVINNNLSIFETTILDNNICENSFSKDDVSEATLHDDDDDVDNGGRLNRKSVEQIRSLDDEIKAIAKRVLSSPYVVAISDHDLDRQSIASTSLSNDNDLHDNGMVGGKQEDASSSIKLNPECTDRIQKSRSLDGIVERSDVSNVSNVISFPSHDVRPEFVECSWIPQPVAASSLNLFNSTTGIRTHNEECIADDENEIFIKFEHLDSLGGFNGRHHHLSEKKLLDSSSTLEAKNQKNFFGVNVAINVSNAAIVQSNNSCFQEVSTFGQKWELESNFFDQKTFDEPSVTKPDTWSSPKAESKENYPGTAKHILESQSCTAKF